MPQQGFQVPVVLKNAHLYWRREQEFTQAWQASSPLEKDNVVKGENQSQF